MNAPVLTVILPVYNEAPSLGTKLPGLMSFAAQNPSYFFRFVDDKSSDSSVVLIQSAITQAGIHNVEILALPKQEGKGNAIFRGFEKGGGKLFCFLDGDLPYSLDHLHNIVQELEKYDIVIGCRNLVPHVARNTKRRKILGWAFNRLARIILNMPYTDTQAGLKGFRKKAGECIFHRQHLIGFAFDVEMLYIAQKHGFSIGEIPAHVAEDHSYKKGKIKLLKDSFCMFGDILSIRLYDLLGKYK